METDSGRSQSIWMGTRMPSQQPLQADTDADVCIVGAGITGLTCAYLLARGGRSVVVVDDGTVGGGETCHTTAHLTNVIDDRYYEIERLHGEEDARLAGESQTAAIDKIEEIVGEEKINCEFERLDGYLFAPPEESQEKLELELPAALRAGLQVERVERAPIPGIDTGPCLRFARQGQFHPLHYLAGLLRAIERDGGRVFTQTHVTEVESDGKRATALAQNGRRVQAGSVVVATNTPINDRFVIHTKQAAYRTYVIAGRVPRGSVTRALYWDSPSPYHYIRLQNLDSSHDLLVVGGEDHKTGQQNDAAQRFGILEKWTRRRFPMLKEIEYRWSGQVMETVDGLAFLGKNPMDADNVYIATGDSGMGMTHGTIGAMIISDLISGCGNPWAKLYDPTRKTVLAAKDFLGENVNVAAQFADYVTAGDVESVDLIKPDSGAIVRRGLSKVAVYRDAEGASHEYSAVCPHLGCLVNWNSTEKSWDCPCHGSRFDAYGRVVNGPAVSGLEAVSPKVGS